MTKMGLGEWIMLCLFLASYTIGGEVASVAVVHTQCRFTRFPKLCVETINGLNGNHDLNVQHFDIMSALVNKTISETKLQLTLSNFEKLSYHFISQEAQSARAAMGYCRELMTMSLKRLTQAQSALQESPTKNKVDIQTWLSAAMTFQETCKETADAQGGLFMAQISKKMDYLSKSCSNQLALVNRITRPSSPGDSSRRLTEEQQRFPAWISARDRKLLQTSTIKANVIVAKDGTGKYRTVSEAIQAAPGSRFVIYVKAGVYKEKINTKKDGITLIGDGKYSTIIVGSDSVGGGSNLPASATFTITGDGFIARDIGFHNAAGPNKGQAVALTVASDHSVFFRCSIAGYQDTLYALSLRQFYRECDIYGTVDFIFGNAAAIFQSCNLVLRRPQGHGTYNVILANGRDDPGQTTGFSVQNCRITAGSDLAPVKHSYNSYLGRPWKEYSRAVVMQSTIDDSIAARGWVEWPGAGSSSLRNLYFGEYTNIGPGAGISKRVQWPGFHVLGREEAVKFTVANFIAGTAWLPSTGVTFVSGL